MNVIIEQTVGKNGVNITEDVKKVQNLLNRWDIPAFLPVNGNCNGKESDQTVMGIKAFQATYLDFPDGRVDPNGETLKVLQKVWKQLPQNFGFGSGYYQYGNSINIGKRQWGTRKTIETLERVSKQFQMKQRTISGLYPLTNHILVGIGDISFRDGKLMPPHESHRKGLNVDIRPCRNDLMQTEVTISDAEYDHDKTKLLIELFLADNNVDKILFNDPEIAKLPRVSKYDGHHDHFHITMRQ